MTHPLEFWKPAATHAQIWRIMLGFIAILVVVILVSVGVFIAASVVLDTPPRALLADSSPQGVALMFATFMGIHLGLAIVLPVLHRRRFRSLFGPAHALNLGDFRNGMWAVLMLSFVITLLLGLEHLLLPTDWVPRFATKPVAEWALWAGPILVLIFIQSSAEELLFRGYLLQNLRARFSSPWIWLIVPSLAFGALHYDPATYGLNAWVYVLNTALVGIILSLITLRRGNLGAAIGLHFLNNAMMLILGLNGSFDTVSLVVMQVDLKGGYMTYSLLMTTFLMVVGFGAWWKWMGKD